MFPSREGVTWLNDTANLSHRFGGSKFIKCMFGFNFQSVKINL